VQHRANLTLTLDEDLLRRARIAAIEQGTSINAAVRRFLEAYAGSGDSSAVEEFLEFADRMSASSGSRGRRWTREDLYADRVTRTKSR
jgi:hypothetical protein